MMNDNRSCNVRWKLHGNISRNSYENAVIGRYGGCFKEDVWAYGFWMYWQSMNNSQYEQKAMLNTEEASKIWMVEVKKNHSLTLVKKNSQAYCKQLAGSTLRA